MSMCACTVMEEARSAFDESTRIDEEGIELEKRNMLSAAEAKFAEAQALRDMAQKSLRQSNSNAKGSGILPCAPVLVPI